MQENAAKLVVLSWPSGEITFSLDRDYTVEQIDSFSAEDRAEAAEADG